MSGYNELQASDQARVDAVVVRAMESLLVGKTLSREIQRDISYVMRHAVAPLFGTIRRLESAELVIDSIKGATEAQIRVNSDMCARHAAEVSELKLALLNERGAGAPPSEGWTSAVVGLGSPCWHHDDSRTWVRPHPQGLGWRWYRYAEDENGLEAQGEAGTAREAMRSADRKP